MTTTEPMGSEVEGLTTMSISQQPQSTIKQDGKSKRLEVSWERDLNKYVADTNRCQQSLESARLQLAARVLESPQIAETWWEFLLHEETTNPEASLSKPGQRTPPGIITLFDLYDWAARLVPQKGNKTKASFVNIWLGHTRQQWLRGKDDALDAIKALKTQQIGLQYAPMYSEWAGLEAASGNASKAISIVAKGLKEGAMPRHVLEEMLIGLKNNTYMYAPFWTTLDAENIKEFPRNEPNTMTVTHQSSASQKEDHAAMTTALIQTPTTGLSWHRGVGQHLIGHQSTAENKNHAATSLHSSSHRQYSSHQQPPSAIANRSAAHRTTLTRTYHSHSSSSGMSSDEATATMRTLGGISSNRSGGSASADDNESTDNMRPVGGPHTAHTATMHVPCSALGTARPSSALSNRATAEETVVVNGNHHGANKSAAGLQTVSVTTPALSTAPLCSTPKDPPSSTLLSKSRSFGGLGKAMRVTPTACGNVPAPQLDAVAQHVASSLVAAGRETAVVDDAADRKRKALVEAVQSPKPPLSTGDGKRRPSCEGDASLRPAAGGAPDLAPILESPSSATAPSTGPQTIAATAAREPGVAPRQVVLEDASGRQAADEETAPALQQTHQQSSRGPQNGSAADPDATVPLSRPVQAMPPPARVSCAIPSSIPATTARHHQQQSTVGALTSSHPQQSAPRSSTRRVIEDENVVVVRDITYTKLECVGRGGSSKVYKVMAPNKKIFALKRIRLNGRDTEAATGFLDEIVLLTKLRGRSNIIQLIDSEVHKAEGLIYMVLEYGDIDLAKLLQRHEQARKERMAHDATRSIDENFIRLYWEQMLHAVDTIHRERIVHSDLKPANFLVVEGQLKLIDFGIAKAIQNVNRLPITTILSADTTSIARESQVGTLNYMSPEAILGGHSAPPQGGPPMKVGRASDIWSLGCILYQMVYGRTPFAHLPFIQKMQAIIDTRHSIEFQSMPNAALLDVIRRCLDRNPRSRITMAELLEHPFLRPVDVNAVAGSKGGAPSALRGISGSVELSKEQLRALLLKVTQACVSDAEVSNLSEQLFTQLSHGDLSSPEMLKRRAAKTSMPPPPSRSMETAPKPSNNSESNKGSVPSRQPLMPLIDAGGPPSS